MDKMQNKEGLSFMPIIKGAVVGLIITVLASVIFSLILLFGDFPESVTLILALLALAAGVYIAGYTSAKTNGEKGLLYGVLAGTFQFLILVILSVCIDRDGFGTLFFIKTGMVLVLSALGGIIGVNSASKRKIV